MNEIFIKQTIQPSDTLESTLDKLCIASENEVHVNYSIFKQIASPQTYSAILSHIFEVVKKTASIYTTIVARIYVKSMTIGDLDKHKPLFLEAINKLSNELPYTLDSCYLYKTPFVFAQIYNLISFAIDKETKQKIHIVK